MPDVTAVVDRIVDGVAVLIVEPDGTEYGIPAADLPAHAGEGTVLHVRGDDPTAILGVDRETTEVRQAGARRRVDRLRRQRSRGRFRRGP